MKIYIKKQNETKLGGVGIMLQGKIIKKLKSQQGTSIFFGLLLFLVASVLSAVILNAAVTTVKTVEADRKTEQNYLTCSSVAKMLQDEIVDTEIVKTVTEKKQGKENKIETSWTGKRKDSSSMSETNPEFAKFLKQYIKSFAESVDSAAIYQPSNFKISIPSGLTDDQKKNMKEVNGTLSVSKASTTDENLKTPNTSYDIKVLLNIMDGSDSCQMVLSLNGKVKTSETETTEGNATSGSGKQTVKTTTIIYGWSPKDIFYGNTGRTGEDS